MAKRKVPITLADGKPRNLFYNFNALVELVDIGVNIMEVQSALNGPGMLKSIRGIIWAGLIHEDKTLTIEAAGDLIEFDKVDEITKAVLEALDIAFKTGGDPKNAARPVTETSLSTVPASSAQANELPTP